MGNGKRKPKRVPGHVDLPPVPDDIKRWIIQWANKHYGKQVDFADVVEAVEEGGDVAVEQDVTPQYGHAVVVDPSEGEIAVEQDVTPQYGYAQVVDPTDDGDDDLQWPVIVAGGDKGWHEQTVPRKSLPAKLWILGFTGTVSQVLKSDIDEDGYRANNSLFWKLSENPEALRQFAANPPEDNDDDSSETGDDGSEPVVFLPGPDPSYRHQYGPEKPPSTLPPIFSHAELKGEFYYRKVTGKVFCGEPDPSNVLQGIGDCYFMASLASIAATPQGKAFLKEKMKAVCGDADEATDWVPAMKTADGDELFACGNRGRKVDDEVALWPVLLEKSFAASKGGYNSIVGGTGDNAFAELGLEAQTFHPRGKSANAIKAWLEQHDGCALVLGTPFAWGPSSSGFADGGGEWEARSLSPPLNVSDLGGFKLVLKSKDKAFPAIVNANGDITVGGTKVIGSILSRDGKTPGEVPENWSGEQIKLHDKRLSAFLSGTCTFTFKEEPELSCRHQYAITAVTKNGLFLWNTDGGGGKVFLSFEKVRNSVASITAGKFRA